MSKRNGDRTTAREEKRRRQQRERERQREHSDHQKLTSVALQEENGPSREYLESLVDTTKLQSETIRHIDSITSQEWPLGNLTEAQEHDIRYKLEVMKLKVYGIHPPAESKITGETRAFLLGDRSEKLQPLSPSERAEIDALFETLKARVTRGRNMAQQEQLSKTIAVSRRDEPEEETDDGFSLFG